MIKLSSIFGTLMVVAVALPQANAEEPAVPAIEVSGVFPRLAMVADHSPLPFPLSKASDSVKQAMIDWVEAGAKRSNLNKK